MTTSLTTRQRPEPAVPHHASSGAEQALEGTSTARYTVDDVLDRCGIWDAFQWLMLGYCGLSWLCNAMAMMLLAYLGHATKCEWNLSPDQEGGLKSVVFGGMCVGAPVWGFVSDRWGRKVAFFLATLTSAIFGFATALAPNIHALLSFRALVGFGIPASSVAFNLLLECTPTRQRGLFAVAIEGFWTVGTVVQAGLAFVMLNAHGWRLLAGVSTMPFVLLLLLLPLVPESPRFLLVRGRVDVAERVLARVMAVCRRPPPEGKLQPLRTSAGADQGADGTSLQGGGTSSKPGSTKAWRGVVAVLGPLQQLLSRKLWGVTLVMLVIWVVAAFTYYGLVQLVPELEIVPGHRKECRNGRLHIPRGDLLGNFVTSAAEVPGLVFSLLKIHFLTRKLAFALPMGLLPVPLIPLMAGVRSWGGVVACMFLARFFIFSAFNALWTLCPEMYPTSVRTFALGLNNSFSWMGGLVSSFAVERAGAAAWPPTPEAIFAALSIAAAALVFLLPRDKKGRTLDDTLEDVQDVAPLERAVTATVSTLSTVTSRLLSGTAQP